MVYEIKHVVWPVGKFGIKVLGAFVLFAALVAGVFAWRVSSSPLDISFIKNTIEASLYDKASGSYASMDKAVLFWPDISGPLYLQIHNGQFFNKEGILIGSTGQIDVSFSGIGLLIGRIMPKAIIIKQPSLRLVRGEDGGFSLDIASDKQGGASKKGSAAAGGAEIIREMLSHIASPVREKGLRSGSLLSRLKGFSIEDARLFVDDKILQQTWSLPDFDLAFMSTGDGAGGFASMSLPGENGGVASELDVAIEYDWWHGEISLATDIIEMNLNDIISRVPALDIPATQDAVVNAHIEVTLDDKNLMPSQVRVDAYSKKGGISYPMLSDKPIPYEELALSVLYDYAEDVLELRDTHISLGGITFEFSGDLKREENEISGPVRIWAKEVKQELIGGIWPEFLKGDDAQVWIVQRMADGVFEEVSVGFDLVAEKQKEEAGGERWGADVANVLVDFKARDMTLDYHAPLPKAYHLYGSGKFDVDNDTLSIEIEKAQIGEMNVGASKVYFDELVAEGVGDADLRFNLNGDVADVLRYISGEPINLGDDIGMDIDKVKGNAELEVLLHFPARADVLLSQFKIDIGGKLSDVVFPGVVKGLDISGGPLELAVKDNLVSLKGEALLDGHQTDLEWEAFLKSEGQAYKEKVNASLRVDEELREKLGIDLSDFLAGALDASLVYTCYRDGTAGAEVSADITPARFFIDPFDYEKPVGESGSVTLNATLKNGELRNIANLNAKAPDFVMEGGKVQFINLPSGIALDKGSAPQFNLGETKASLEFAYDKNRTVDIKLEGEFLDVRPFMDSEEKQEEYNEPPMRIAVKADKARTAPGQLAENVRAYFVIDGQGRFDQMEMDAHIGASDVFVRFDSVGNEDGKRTFRMKTEDAGALLRAFGVYSNVIGGTMLIYGEPMHWIYDRNIRGKAQISGFKVVKAPALAKMLSLLSLGGITEALSSDGLNFDKMEVDFSWLYRKNGSLMKLKNGRTSGNTLGILFEGTFDNNKREVDVSGTVAPMSGLNKFIGKIPLVGDILTGGSGGVFAATYSIKGSSENPQVSVNPLSVLTPGILRRILWE